MEENSAKILEKGKQKPNKALYALSEYLMKIDT